MIFGCAGSSLLHRLQSCREWSVETSLQLQCTGFSLWWFLLLWSSGSRACGLNSCGLQIQLLCGMWDLPRPEMEPLSPALAGRLFTTEPPRKPAIFLSLLTNFVLDRQPLFFSCNQLGSSEHEEVQRDRVSHSHADPRASLLTWSSACSFSTGIISITCLFCEDQLNGNEIS